MESTKGDIYIVLTRLSKSISKSSVEEKYSIEEDVLKIQEKWTIITTNNMVIEAKD